MVGSWGTSTEDLAVSSISSISHLVQSVKGQIFTTKSLNFSSETKFNGCD